MLTSFQDGTELGDGLRLLVSPDGLKWSELPGAPLILPRAKAAKSRVFRDPSMVYHGGHFHLVFTSDLCVDQVPGHWQCRRHTKPRPVARFGYARSRDLVKWEAIKHVEMPVKDACSLWAPEATLLPQSEGGGLMVIFTVTVAAGTCPPTMRESDHKPYYVISRDFKNFGAPKPLDVNHGESIIDMFPLLMRGGEGIGGDGGGDAEEDGGSHVLFYKAEANLCGRPYDAPLEWRYGSALHTNASCSLVLRQARASKATGPWRPDLAAHGSFFSDAISRPCVEGPTIVKSPDERSWILLFDNYRSDCLLLVPRDDTDVVPCSTVAGRPAGDAGLRLSHRGSAHADGMCAYEPSRQGFGAMVSDDLRTWTDISGSVSAPPFHKHGTAIKLLPRAWKGICDEAQERRSPFAAICSERAAAGFGTT